MNSTNDNSGTELKILVLEDSAYDLEIMLELLLDAGFILDLTHVNNQSDFESSLQKNFYNIILSDYNLPGFNAFGALEICNQICPDVPFICISGSIGEEKAIELLKLGAIDYVLKDRPERLPFAIKRALAESKANLNQKKAIKALFESEKRFKQVAEDALEWIWEIDTEGLYTYSSPVIKNLLGYSPEEIVGKFHFYDLFVPDRKDELLKSSLELMSKKDLFRQFENPNLHKNGNIIILETNGSPIFDSDGNYIGYRGVDTDITERKKMLEDLIAAKIKAEESDKLKTAFLHNISHEIRTPLNGILGFGQLLTETHIPDDQKVEYFEIIKKSSNRLMNTISDYIDMAMLFSGTMRAQMTEFDLDTLLDKIIEGIRHKDKSGDVIFTSSLPANQQRLRLYSDPEFIRKIIEVLLNNAIKFTKYGTINFGYEKLPGQLNFFVEDTGEGVAPDKLELIFEMFAQEDYSNAKAHSGSGLGLSIAKGLVKLLGGEIHINSTKNKGSVFCFTIPYNEPEENNSIATKSTTNNNSEKDILILIAEDEQMNYLYLAEVMKLSGFKIIRAETGEEAVELCKQNDDINLVLMDIKMPVLNGIEATKQIHVFKPELPIIAITAYAQTGDKHRCIEAGCIGYLAKPIRKEDILNLLQEIIDTYKLK